MNDNLSILYPPGTDLNAFRSISPIAWHDLGMDAICSEICAKEEERSVLRRVMSSLSPDPKTANFRGEVFEDILRCPSLRKTIMELLRQVDNLQDYMSTKRNIDKTDGIWTLTRRLKEVRDYILCIEALENALSQETLHSEGLKNLRDYVRRIQSDCAFAELKSDIAGLYLETKKVKSVTLGVNLNENYEAESMGIVSLNDKPFTKANVLSAFTQKLGRQDVIQQGSDWNGSMAYHASADDENAPPSMIEKTMLIFGAAANPLIGLGIGLAHIRNKSSEETVVERLESVATKMLTATVRELKTVLANHATVSIYSITNLIPEFLYYILWADYVEKLTKEGYSFCRAEAMEEASSCRMSAEDICNLKLPVVAKLPPADVVGNDLIFDKEHTTYILTGANRGGKTTITQAVGQMFVLAQGGIYVPGKSFRYRPVDGIFTHFPADEDKTLDFGRLGEECSRFRSLFSDCTEDSLLLLNETFSTTSFEEGYYIAFDAVRAILRKGIRTIYNTHMHKLAREIDLLNDGSCEVQAASLVVRADDGKRSYKVEVTPAQGLSYAVDIARKYGVTFEQLMNE